MNQINKNLKLVITIIFIIILIIFASKFGIFEQINKLLNQAINYIESLGNLGAIAFILLYIICSLLLISGAILTLSAGLIFGVIKGSIIVSIASTLAATFAFLVGRYLLRNWVEKQIEKQPNFKAIDLAVNKEGWKIVSLTRLSPLFPFVFLNYAFGVTQVSLRDYVLASWIGMMPGTIMYVYIGFIGQSASQGNTLKLVLNIIGLIATIAVTIYVTKIAKKALDNQVTIDD